MLEHPATEANLALLRSRGVQVLDSPSGALTGADVGRGRMAEPEDIAEAVFIALDRLGATKPTGDLEGFDVLVTAGGTREPLDPVRFLGNASSGKQGFAIARAAAQRGAKVTTIAAPSSEPFPKVGEVVQVTTALEMEAAVKRAAPRMDLVVMAAAVADYRPVKSEDTKIKRAGRETMQLELMANPDILAGLIANRRPGQVIVGFAAETGDRSASAVSYAASKARSKGADLTVGNAVTGGAVFGSDANAVVIFDSKGRRVAAAEGPKAQVADAILDAAKALLPGE
jgi:phosphopantothenoylcysteine decarboxylase/phosphopantothenate--cysteine ligase